MKILSGDIGGTKSNFAVFEVLKDQSVIKTESIQLASREFKTFQEMTERLKSHLRITGIEAVSIGIAGPVISGECKATNLPWSINVEEMGKLFGTQLSFLLNDLEATAYGMLYLADDELMELNPSALRSSGHCSVIAAGTGLGEAILFWNGSRFHPIGSEGGHTDFAPSDAQQDDLLQWLRLHYPDHVSYERILSGPGIYALYRFLAESGFAPEPSAMRSLDAEEDPSAAVHRCAVEENDPLCTETLRLFSRIYGAEAGNLALKTMSLGGVYIGGGIAPKILPFLRECFMESFVRKGRFGKLLGTMPVRVSLNPETALLGAAHYAHDRGQVK